MLGKGRNIFFVFLLLIFVSSKMMAQDILPDSIQTNTAATEEIQPDTIKKSSSVIEAPINYVAKDSMVMVLDGRNEVFLYGEGVVDYQTSKLTGEYIEIDAARNEVYSTFGLDSIGEEFGYPVFKDGGTEYEIKEVRYNFKTKKMYSRDIITQQGEGYVTAAEVKKLPNDDSFIQNARYTTCDEHDHPHFYFQLSKGKIRPKKNVVTSFAYLVVEDVPLPIAVPFAFFPFKSDYASGILMPSFDDELRRGFSLNNGGYYFAFNDHVDLALTGDIYTKGSWGLKALSTYRKRYKYSGNINASYIVTIEGDKGANDYSKAKDFMVKWSHRQDSKAHPFQTFSASVDFSTSSYDRNSLNSIYAGLNTNSTKASTVNYSYRFPDSPFSMSVSASVNQVARDTTLSVTLPNLTVNMRDVYPFKRKEQIGNPRWYENIRMSYSGALMNSITAKEYDFMDKNIIKDWRNGMKHSIPISASFNLFKYLNITPSFNYEEKWYTSKIEKGYDYTTGRYMNIDTVYGFNRVYNYSASISASTKLYGFFKPWDIFGNKAKNTLIRHVITPSVSFSGAPDFSAKRYGYYRDLTYIKEGLVTDSLPGSPIFGRETIIENYNVYENQIWGAPGRGSSGTLSFSIDNNLEMKIPQLGTDSAKKISLIDNLRLGMSYNFLADSMNWSNLSASIRLKLPGDLTINLSGVFDTYTYAYDEETNRVTRVNVPRWKAGKGIGRLMSTGTSFSYTLDNGKVKGWFTKTESEESAPDSDDYGDGRMEDISEEPQRQSLRQKKKSDDKYDADGYWLADIPWSLSFNCSMSLAYDSQKFNKETLEYGYKVIPTLGVYGNITPTKNWSFNFSTNYDFEYKKFTTLNCSITRKMHCWQMSANIVPIGPYQSYHFSIAVSSSILKDFKYNQSSSYRDAINWGN